MKTQYPLLIITILGILLVAGCEDTSNTQTDGSPYRGGTQGIVATFESFGVVESGIPTIFEGETIPVEVTLRNKGEETLAANTGIVTLKGISTGDYDGIVFDKNNGQALDKVSEVNPTGGEETLDFGDATYKHDILTTFYDATIFASYVYPYATHVAVPKVCFKEDVTDTSICNLEETKQSFSSGAPIAVTGVVQRRAGAGLIALEYTVSNVGGGEVTAPTSDFDSRFGQIAFQLDPNSNPENWECKMGGQENAGRLEEGKGIILCKLKTSAAMQKGDLYTKQIDLTISYKYRDLIQQSVRIKNKD